MAKILCIDDDPNMRALLTQILQKKGHEVAVVSNGVQGIEKTYTWLPDLILLDVMMVDIDGREVCRRLKANSQTQTIPIIFVTARNDIETKIEGFEAGGGDYIVKPFFVKELLETINAQLTIRQLEEKMQVAALSHAIMKAKYSEFIELAFELEIWQQYPQLAKILNDLTKLTSNIIHDLHNRLGILVNYDSQARTCLQLLENLAFLRFKSLWSFSVCHESSKILIEDIIAQDIGVQIDGPPFIMVNGFVDIEMVTITLNLFLAEIIRQNKLEINCLKIKDKLPNNPSYYSFGIEISGLVLSSYDYSNEGILAGNKVNIFWFLLEKVIFLHIGTCLITEMSKVDIWIPRKVTFSGISDLQINQLRNTIQRFQLEFNQSGETEPNIYLVIRELVADMLIQLDQIYLKAYQQTNLKIQEIIQRNSQYAQLLLQNLLWLGAGMETPLESVNVNEALESVRQIMRSEIRIRDAADDDNDDFIEVKLDLQPDLLPVLANQVNLQQVFMNLITNALEVMPRSGTLGLKTYQQAQDVMIEISDTGTGIKPEHLERIFELSFSTKQGQERGVGLHVVHSIVKKFGGEIEVKSEVGKGTTFIVSLPGQTA